MRTGILPPIFGWRRYAAATVVLLIAVLLQMTAQPLFRGLVPFIFFFPALILAAVYLGRGPAILVLCGSVVAAISLMSWLQVPGIARSTEVYAVLSFVIVGAMIAMFGVNLRQARRDVGEAEARLLNAQEVAGVGVWEADLISRTVVASPATWRLIGAEPVTGHVSWGDFQKRFNAAGLSDDIVNLGDTAERQRDQQEFESRIVLQSGDARWLYSRVRIERDSFGRPLRLQGATLDITARKRAEEATQEEDRRKDEFLAILAHELRNPLAPIRYATRLAAAPNAAASQVRWSLEVIGRQTEHMARLLDDLLEVSRISRGKLELRRERVPFAKALSAAIETARPLIEAKHHELSVDVPDEELVLDADPVRLAQILGNLLTNAAKYTDANGHIAIRAVRERETLVVTVRDDGIGISEEMLPQIFEMFAQGGRALERAEGGLGIGLSLVRGLVGLHGGSIEARSDGPGKGSEFSVRLPVVVSDPQIAAADEPAAQEINRVPCRVLIADDNSDAAESLALLLRMQGHQVHSVTDGEQAIALATRVRPQVVLLDIGMPRISGYDVARRIRAEEWGRSVTLVAITGWGQEQDKQRARAAGFDYHLTKPVDAAALERFLQPRVREPVGNDVGGAR